jgi:ribosomal protein S6--L-glutamate ligase
VNIIVLSQKPQLYSTQRLVEAGEKRGHTVRVIDYMQCYMTIAAHRPKVIFEGEPVGADAIIPRIGAANTFYGTAVVRQFEMAGVYSINPSQAISRARDKLRSLQILASKGIGMPITAFAHSTREVQDLIRTVGGAPLIVKLLEGTQGIGVVLTETEKAAESVIEAFRGLEANILVQEFIREAEGTDLRCFVVDGRVVASMQRTAHAGEFRANMHRGATAEKAKLTPEERMVAVTAAKAIGLRVAGVDIIRSNHGPLVIEVNASPGLEGIEDATKKDVAGRMIEHLERQAEAGKRSDRVGH